MSVFYRTKSAFSYRVQNYCKSYNPASPYIRKK